MELGNYLISHPLEYHLLLAVASITLGAVVIKLSTLVAAAGEALLGQYRKSTAAAPIGRPVLNAR